MRRLRSAAIATQALSACLRGLLTNDAMARLALRRSSPSTIKTTHAAAMARLTHCRAAAVRLSNASFRDST